MFEKIIGYNDKMGILAVDSNLEVSELDLILNLNKEYTYFVFMNVEGIEDNHKIPSALISLACSQNLEGKEIELYKCNSVSSEILLMIKANGAELMSTIVSEESQVYKITFDDLENDDDEKRINLDITPFVQDIGGDNIVMFAFRCSSNESNIMIKLTNSFVVYTQNIHELTSFTKFQQFDLGFAGTSSVNLYNGHMYHSHPGISTNLSKLPLNHSFTFADGYNTKNNMIAENSSHLITVFFDEKQNELKIKNHLGQVSVYSNITGLTDEELEKLKVERGETEDQYFIFYNYAEKSYIHLSGIPSFSMITGINITFQTQVKYSYDFLGPNVLKLRTIKTQLGETITYNYNDNNELTSITNEYGESLVFTYSNGLVSSITNPASQDKLEIAHESHGRISSILYLINGTDSSYYYKRNQTVLSFDENGENILEIIDSSTDTKINFVYDNYKVTQATISNTTTNEIIDQMSFTYGDNYTIVTNFKGESLTYFFDDWGQCISINDDKGRTLTHNYDKFEEGESLKLNGTSKVQYNARNLLFNFSFENEKVFSEEGWVLASGDSSKVKQIDGGMYGGKSLFIDKDSNTAIKISQEALLPSSHNNSFSLSGFVKCYKRDGSEVNNSDCIIKLIIGYNIKLPSNPGSGIVGPSLNEGVNQTYTASWKPNSSILNWEEFNINGVIPSAGTLNSIKVEVVLSGSNCVVELDDFQLCNTQRQTRFNYVENGYFDKFDSTFKPKGWTFTNTDAGDKLVDLVSTIDHPESLSKKVMKLSGKSLFSGNSVTTIDNKKKSISQTINLKGSKNDRITFVAMGKGLFANSSRLYATVKFNYLDSNNTSTEDKEFEFVENFDKWQMLVREVVAEDSYNSITITITSTCTTDCYIDAIQLYKDSYGTKYSYNEFNQISQVVNENGETTMVEYDEENNIKEVKKDNGDFYRFTYGENKKVIKVEDHLLNVVNYTYDDNDNIIKVETINSNGDRMVKKFTYNATTSMLESETDELGNTITYTYDNNSASYRHGLVTMATLNNTFATSYSYNEALLLNNVVATRDSTTHSNAITYTNKREVNGFSNDTSNYSFIYDDLGNLTNIKYYGLNYGTLEYGKTTNNINHNLVTKQTNSDGTVYEFEYDDKDRVMSVDKNSVNIQEYEYDELGNLTRFKERIKGNSNEEDTFEEYRYDYLPDGKLYKISQDGKNIINYDYDTLGQVQKLTYGFDDVNKSFEFMHLNEMKDISPVFYFTQLASEYKDEVIKYGTQGKGMFGANPLAMMQTYKEDSILQGKVYFFNQKSHYMWYDVSSFNSEANASEDNRRNEISSLRKTFFMWVRPTGSYQQLSLFTLQKFTDADTVFLSDVVVTSEGYLGYKPLNGDIEFTTSNKLVLDKWNLVGIQFNREAEGDTTTARLILNDEQTIYYGLLEDMGDITHLLLGYQANVIVEEEESSSSSSEETTSTSSNLTMPFEVCLISGGSFNYNVNDFTNIYKHGNNSLNIGSALLSDGFSYYNGEDYEGFEVVTLNGSFVSNKGLKPFAMRSLSSAYNKDKLFVFDKDVKKEVFECVIKNNKSAFVAYKPNYKDKLTISLRFKLNESTNNDRELLYLENVYGECISLNIKNKKLRLGINYSNNATALDVIENKWYNLVLTFNDTTCNVYLDDIETIISENISDSIHDINSFNIYFGTESGRVKTLDGFIEMLAFKEEYYSSRTSLTMLTNNSSVSSLNGYDSVGRLVKKDTFIKDQQFHNEYKYEERLFFGEENGTDIRSMPLIEEETLIDGRKQTYTYDSYGNVTRKRLTTNEGVLLEEEIYTYDELFRVTSFTHKTYEDEEVSNEIFHEYTYDKNGNMTFVIKYLNDETIAEIDYMYHMTYKDRLSSVINTWSNGTTTSLTYSTSDRFKPNKITKAGVESNLVWDGNNLVQYGNYKYKYNTSGIRIEKEVGGVTTRYILDGDKVIGLVRTENDESVKLVFNYDYNNLLLGFSIGNQEYIYIRDILGNILGIIDQEGNVVVYYKYDVWGNLLEEDIKISNSASLYNPFLYKGYIYDVETGLFWLSSRYYSPELCRFIQPDDIEYLDPESINGLNLYAYCFNNPIMYVDSSGHFPVAVDKILSGVEHSLGFYKFLLDHSIKGLKPEFIPLDIAKKIARKGGHRQSARAVQRTIYNSTDDLIKNTTRTSRNVNNFLKKFGKTVFILDSAWTIGENIYNGNEHWFTDSAYDISWNALVYGASLLPGGFFWSLVVVGVKSLIEYNYGYEIECFLDDVGDAWNEFWSFDWI